MLRGHTIHLRVETVVVEMDDAAFDLLDETFRFVVGEVPFGARADRSAHAAERAAEIRHEVSHFLASVRQRHTHHAVVRLAADIPVVQHRHQDQQTGEFLPAHERIVMERPCVFRLDDSGILLRKARL